MFIKYILSCQPHQIYTKSQSSWHTNLARKLSLESPMPVNCDYVNLWQKPCMSPVHYVNIQRQQLNINNNNKNNCADYTLAKFKTAKKF